VAPAADCRLPFKDECMDLVACNPVYEPARDAPALMREVARALRRGGAALPTHAWVLRR
jgi:ubiquinone/menaquinone biosynthesis C-methylase UbiE